MTHSRVFSVQAAIVFGTGILLLALIKLMGPEARPPEWVYFTLLPVLPVALIAVASRFDRTAPRKLPLLAGTVGWVLLGCFVVLLAWVNTHGS